jgi:tetratricopeptide (TPR) repeat protein
MRLQPVVMFVVWILAGLSVVAADERLLLKAREAGLALARGEIDQAITLYTEVLADKTLSNDRRALTLVDRGVAHARRQSPRDAIEDFNQAIQLYPEYAAVYNNRGSVLLSIGAAREAIKDFDRAVVLAPGYTAAYTNRAGAHTKLGQFEAAIADYSKAIALVPTSAAALTGRARVHLDAYRPQAAIRDSTRAVNADARFSAAYRARAEAKLSLGKVDEAIEDLSRAVAFEVRSGELYQLRGEAYLQSQSLAAAVKDFTTAIELNPRNTWTYIVRGYAHAKLGTFEDALNDFARAIELDQRSAKPFAYRAWTYAKQHQLEAAQKDVDRALKLDPNSAEAYWARAELRQVQSQQAAAIQDLQKAVSLDPTLREPVRVLEWLGVNQPKAESVELTGAGRDGWRLFSRGKQYIASHDQYARVKVDVEMIGAGEPRILEWQTQKDQFSGIGLLRFQVGTVTTARGPEEIEQIAIVDTANGTVAGYETARRGSKTADLTWDDGLLTVLSADGTRESYQLRPSTRVKDIPVAAQQPPKRVAKDDRKPAWTPWGENRRGKPKSLFELLFGN